MFDEFYGLDARPFQLTPDPAFYFESLTHRKALSYLGYGLAQGEGFVVITGEVGAGKSTLVAHMMSSIDPQQLTVAHVVTSALDGEEIVHVVARAFGIEVAGHDKATALGLIEQFLQDEARAGRRCLLIVDETQNLQVSAIEELRMLSNFQLGAHPLLQTLLLGQPEFRTLLLTSNELEQLRQRVIATHHLDAMQADEIRPYVEHRMTRAGWQGRPSFQDDLFPDLFEVTAGIPRRINQVLNRLLLLGAIEQREEINAAMLAQVLNDLDRDGSIALVAPKSPTASRDGSSIANLLSSVEDEDLHGGSAALAAAAAVETAITERDSQIHELQQAVIELANSVEEREEAANLAHAELVALIDQQVEAIHARLTEQDRTIRHALTMMIEWIESGETPRAVA